MLPFKSHCCFRIHTGNHVNRYKQACELSPKCMGTDRRCNRSGVSIFGQYAIAPPSRGILHKRSDRCKPPPRKRDRGTLFFGSQGTQRQWRSSSEHCSPNYTLNFAELPASLPVFFFPLAFQVTIPFLMVAPAGIGIVFHARISVPIVLFPPLCCTKSCIKFRAKRYIYDTMVTETTQ